MPRSFHTMHTLIDLNRIASSKPCGRWTVLIFLVLLSGCQNAGYVPVHQAGERQGDSVYIVQRGDTLYSIAFRYGVDYQELAAANGIKAPYTIFINQRIKLLARAEPVMDSGPTETASTPPVSPTRKTVPKTNPKTPPAPRVLDSNIVWQWPYEGEVVDGFSLTGKVNKGIDIRGKTGDPVRSSAAGVVVYAGGGLRGYGKLVIVKHNESFLSAYGHNESLLVKEGEQVKAGQVVARIGGGNGEKDLLHFEIRRKGKPEDPLRYLPPRNS